MFVFVLGIVLRPLTVNKLQVFDSERDFEKSKGTGESFTHITKANCVVLNVYGFDCVFR